MRFFIIPSEPLLFRRTGRSFTAGESGYADTLFPPTPETIQGAVRAAIATHWNRNLTLAEAFQKKELTDLIGIRSEYGRFRITGMAVGRRQKDGTLERLFPAPASLQQDSKKELVRLHPVPLENVRSNMPYDMQYLLPEKEAEGKLKMVGWLTENGLLKTLRGELPAREDIVKEEDVRVFEPRLGIGIDSKTKTTREGLLYQMRMVRLNHEIESKYIYGFVVDVHLAQPAESNESATSEHFIDDSQTRELLNLPEKGWVTLGGERRAAYFEIIDSPDASETNHLEHAKQGKMLYLATPAGFKEGWKPVNWQPEAWRQPLPRPVAVAIDHYQSIGGWLLTPGSSSGGGDKPILRCVPAGSVYFFDQSVTMTRPFTDHGWQIGYGIAYTGEWKQ